MKYTIDKNRLENFLKKKLGVDLEGKIIKVTDPYKIPYDFTSHYLTYEDYKMLLEKHGPMFLVETPEALFLAQKRYDIEEGKWMILEDIAETIFSNLTSEHLVNKLGIGLEIPLELIIDFFTSDEEKENLTENIKNFIEKKLKIDLNDRIQLLTSTESVPQEFTNRYLSKSQYRRAMNSYGPFYLIKGNGMDFLVQPRSEEWGEKWIGRTSEDEPANESLVLSNLGLDVLGVSLSKLIDLYLDENNPDHLLESESKGIVDVINRFMVITYPNFSIQKAEIKKIRKTIPGVFVPENYIIYRDADNGYIFAKYWTRYKELQLNGHVYLDLETKFSGHMVGIVDWFNKEFNQDAESVTY